MLFFLLYCHSMILFRSMINVESPNVMSERIFPGYEDPDYPTCELSLPHVYTVGLLQNSDRLFCESSNWIPAPIKRGVEHLRGIDPMNDPLVKAVRNKERSVYVGAEAQRLAQKHLIPLIENTANRLVGNTRSEDAVQAARTLPIHRNLSDDVQQSYKIWDSQGEEPFALNPLDLGLTYYRNYLLYRAKSNLSQGLVTCIARRDNNALRKYLHSIEAVVAGDSDRKEPTLSNFLFGNENIFSLAEALRMPIPSPDQFEARAAKVVEMYPKLKLLLATAGVSAQIVVNQYLQVEKIRKGIGPESDKLFAPVESEAKIVGKQLDNADSRLEKVKLQLEDAQNMVASGTGTGNQRAQNIIELRRLQRQYNEISGLRSNLNNRMTTTELLALSVVDHSKMNTLILERMYADNLQATRNLLLTHSLVDACVAQMVLVPGHIQDRLSELARQQITRRFLGELREMMNSINVEIGVTDSQLLHASEDKAKRLIATKLVTSEITGVSESLTATEAMVGTEAEKMAANNIKTLASGKKSTDK